MLNDTLVMLPFLPEPVSVESSPFLKRFPVFIPKSGTIEYGCVDNDTSNMTVRAYLETDPDIKPLTDTSDEARFFFYEGKATLFPHNSTIVHVVSNSNDDEYIGRRLYRTIEFAGDSQLLLTPIERVSV